MIRKNLEIAMMPCRCQTPSSRLVEAGEESTVASLQSHSLVASDPCLSVMTNRQCRIGLLLLIVAVLCCLDVAQGSNMAPAAHSERFWPKSSAKSAKPKPSAAEPTYSSVVETISDQTEETLHGEKDTSTQSSKGNRLHLSDLLPRRGNGTNVEGNDDAPPSRNRTEAEQKETRNHTRPAQPDWLRRLVGQDEKETTSDSDSDSQKEEEDSFEDQDELSKKKYPSGNRKKEFGAGNVPSGWPGWFPVPERERRTSTVQEDQPESDALKKDAAHHVERDSAEHRTIEESRGGVHERRWPFWFPIGSTSRAQEDHEIEAERRLADSMMQEDQTEPNALEEDMSDQMQTSVDAQSSQRGSQIKLPAWFPKGRKGNRDDGGRDSKGDTEASVEEESVTKINSDQVAPGPSTRGKASRVRRRHHQRRRETAASKKIHDFRDRISRNKQGKKDGKSPPSQEEKIQMDNDMKPLEEVGSPHANFESENKSLREDYSARTPRIGSLQQSVFNLTTSIRRLPWSARPNVTADSTTGRRQYSALNRSVFHFPPTRPHLNRSIGEVPVSSFRFIRNLPWTSKLANNPNISAPYDNALTTVDDPAASEPASSSRKHLNPIKFILGLPWTPVVYSRKDDIDSSPKSNVGSSYQSEAPPIGEDRDPQPYEMNKADTKTGSSEGKIDLAQKEASVTELPRTTKEESKVSRKEIVDSIGIGVKRSYDATDRENDKLIIAFTVA